MEQEEKPLVPMKLGVTAYIMWMVRNHWLWIFLVIGVQYVSGQMMVGGFSFIPSVLSIETWLKVHRLNGQIIILSVLVMVAVRGYLWLLRKGKIS